MTSNRPQKTSAWRAAVALPAVVLIGLGGSALMAAPALAETAPPTDPATSTASAAPTDAATPAPAASTPAPTQTAAPSPSATASTPKPKALATVTKLKVTSPTPVDWDSDDDPVPVKLPSRTFDIVGTAPSGSTLQVDDDDTGETLATYRVPAGTTAFSIPMSFGADEPYLRDLDVFGQHGETYLDDSYLELEFPAGTSIAPTLDVPSVTSFSVAPLPLGLSTIGHPVKLTGTGTPGEYIQLFFTKPGAKPDTSDFDEDGFDEAGFLLGSQSGLVTVRDDSTWTAYAYLDYGTTSVFAGEQQLAFDADGFAEGPLTHISPLSGSADITLTKPAGSVDAPVIVKPSYFDDLDGSFVTIGSGTASISPFASSAAKVSHPTGQAAESAHAAGRSVRARGLADAASASAARTAPSLFANLSAPRASATASGSSGSSSSSSESVDSEIAEDGIQVKGVPSTTRPGYLTTTVVGTGTPGDHVVVYAEDGDIADSYLSALYPGLITGFQALIDSYFTDSSNVVPPTFSADTVASLLPADPGTITVAADGTWSTTLTLKPGSYGLTAFAVDPTTKTYSAAGLLLGVHLTGTPIVDPAATTTAELAFTGSQGSTAAGLGGLGAVLAGVGLLVVARRRRPRAE